MSAQWVDGAPQDLTIENLEKIMLELWGKIDNLPPTAIYCRAEDQQQLQAELDKLCQLDRK